MFEREAAIMPMYQIMGIFFRDLKYPIMKPRNINVMVKDKERIAIIMNILTDKDCFSKKNSFFNFFDVICKVSLFILILLCFFLFFCILCFNI